MVSQERKYTAEEFWELARTSDHSEQRLELQDGAIIEMAPSSPQNAVIAGLVIYFLNAYVVPKKLGYVTVPDGGFRLSAHTVRQPDAAFVSRERMPHIPNEFNLAPDLAVEVVSPKEDIFLKANEYLEAGTKLVWAIYPERKTVYSLRLIDGQLVSTPHGFEDTLTEDDILPGFSLKVGDIFPE